MFLLKSVDKSPSIYTGILKLFIGKPAIHLRLRVKNPTKTKDLFKWVFQNLSNLRRV